MADVVIIRPISHSWDKEKYMRYVSIPHGLLYLASTLVEKGYTVKIIDEVVEDDAEGELRKALKESPICVGISSMTGRQIKNGVRFTEIVRNSGDTPVVWGGAHPTVSPMMTLEDPMVDIVVYGEGENSFLELVSSLEKGKAISDIRGVCYKHKGNLYRNEPAEPGGYDALPNLPYHLIKMEQYITSIKKRKITRYFEVISSRGCPYRCTYCYNSIAKTAWKRKSIDRVINEIRFLIEEYAVDGISFNDENFSSDKKRIVELCEKIIKEKLIVTYRALARVDDICRFDASILNLMKRAGFDYFAIGAESGSDRILKYINKKITTEQVYQANKKLREYGFAVTYNFMSAFPTETLIEFIDTLKMILELFKSNEDIIYPINGPSYFTPFPGTILFNEAIRLGFNPPKGFRDWMRYDYNNVDLPWLDEKFRKFMDEARNAVIELNEKFAPDGAKLRPTDYALLKDIIERGIAMAEGTATLDFS